MDDRMTPMSRRAMVASLGAAAAGVALRPGRADASGAVPTAQPGGRPELSAAPLGALPTAVLSHRLNAIDFRAEASSVDWTATPGALVVANTATVSASFHPRAGDQLLSVAVHLTTLSASSTVRLVATDLTGVSTVLAEGTFSGLLSPTTVTLQVPNAPYHADPETTGYTVQVTLALGVTLHGATITTFSRATSLVLVDPLRVWDSRTAQGALLFPGATAGGRIRSGDLKGFTVDSFVPRASYGLLLNVTLDQTVGAGYLTFYAENPDDPTPPTFSSINWYAAGQIVANLVVTQMAGEADVAIACGGGGNTHYVVDLLGYWV